MLRVHGWNEAALGLVVLVAAGCRSVPDEGAVRTHERAARLRALSSRADAGETDAMLSLARELRRDGDVSAARSWYRKAGTVGSPATKREAAEKLMVWTPYPFTYPYPPGPQPSVEDRTLIMAWLRESAEAGDVESMLRLAELLDHGWASPTGGVYRMVVENDWSDAEWEAQRAAATRWYLRAAATDDPLGMVACAVRLAGKSRNDDLVALQLLRRVAAAVVSSSVARAVNAILERRPGLREPEDDVFLGDGEPDPSEKMTTTLLRELELVVDVPEAGSVDTMKPLGDLQTLEDEARGDARKLGALAALCDRAGRSADARRLAHLALKVDIDDPTASNVMAVYFYRRAVAGPHFNDNARRAGDSYITPFARRGFDRRFASLVNYGVALCWLSLLNRDGPWDESGPAREAFERAKALRPGDPLPDRNASTFERLAALRRR